MRFIRNESEVEFLALGVGRGKHECTIVGWVDLGQGGVACVLAM